MFKAASQKTNVTQCWWHAKRDTIVWWKRGGSMKTSLMFSGDPAATIAVLGTSQPGHSAPFRRHAARQHQMKLSWREELHSTQARWNQCLLAALGRRHRRNFGKGGDAKALCSSSSFCCSWGRGKIGMPNDGCQATVKGLLSHCFRRQQMKGTF